jgi:hypothetical protein
MEIEKIRPKKDLFKPLSDTELSLVKDNMSGDGIVVQKFSVTLKKHDLRTLKGTSWLNDEVFIVYIGYKFLWRVNYGARTLESRQIPQDTCVQYFFL